jgi:hypothetical protein
VVIARKAAIALRKNVILLWDLYAKFFDYGVSQGHFAKNRNLAFSAFFWEMSILRSQEVIAKMASITKIGSRSGRSRLIGFGWV